LTHLEEKAESIPLLADEFLGQFLDDHTHESFGDDAFLTGSIDGIEYAASQALDEPKFLFHLSGFFQLETIRAGMVQGVEQVLFRGSFPIVEFVLECGEGHTPLTACRGA
jgi:hypothetical protein